MKKLFLAFLVVMSALSYGASFDCVSSNITRPAEKLICANAEVSKLDESMVNLYKQNKAQLSESSKIVFANGQRSWLAYWPKYCSNDGKGRVFDKESGVPCVKEAYRKRIEELKIGLLDRKFMYFQIAKYSALAPGKDLPDYAKVIGHMLVYPKIETQGLSAEDITLASTMNSWIAGLLSQEKIDFNNPEIEDSFTLQIETTSSDIMSVVQNYYFNGFGAHPVSALSQSHFVKSKLKKLTAADIFTNQEWVKPVSSLIFQDLKKQQSDMLLINGPTDLSKLITNPDSWSLTRKGLIFNFNVYEVAAYAAGQQEVTIPWKNLMPFLTDYAKSESAKIYK